MITLFEFNKNDVALRLEACFAGMQLIAEYERTKVRIPISGLPLELTTAARLIMNEDRHLEPFGFTSSPLDRQVVWTGCFRRVGKNTFALELASESYEGSGFRIPLNYNQVEKIWSTMLGYWTI